MRFVEETGGSWTAEQLRAAEAEIEQQKREWEANRLAAIKKEEEEQKRAADEDEMLTYSREDAQNQVNNNKFSKRNPVNRRLLKVKQSDRHGIVKNKRVKGRIAARQTIRSVAQNALGPRRALRNNSKSLSSLAQSHLPNSGKKIDETKQLASASTSTKRNVSIRLSSRLNKQAEQNDESMVSSDDEPLVDPNKNNGVATNSHGKTTKTDNEHVGEQSECSDQRHSEEFDDSECSLDVMVDSTDPQESDEETAGDDDEHESTTVQSDDSAMSCDDTDTDVTTQKSLLNNTLKDSLEPNHQIDVNSPRSTRSHGRIKINLWTLDESQNLPELCAKRGHHKTGGSKNSSFATNADYSTDMDACENGNGSSADDFNENDNSTVEDSDNNSSTKTETKANMRQSKISDCFAKSTSKVSGKTTPTIEPSNVIDNRARKSLPMKSVKVDKSTTASTTSVSTNAKNHNSFDIFIRSPKVVLNKHDVELQQQKARLKSKN